MRGSIERLLAPTPSPQVPASAPSKPAPKSPAPPQRTAATLEELRALGLQKLHKLFDVEILRPKARFPSLEKFRELTADGADQEGLLGSASDDVPTLWVLEDEQGYCAVLLGPHFGQNYEDNLRRSITSFRLPGATYSSLRATNLGKLLERETLGSGWLIVVSRGDRAVGTLVSLDKFLKVFNLINLTK